VLLCCEKITKITKDQTEIIIRNIDKMPANRKHVIEHFIRIIKFGDNIILNWLEVGVSNKFAAIPVKMLKPPTLLYVNNKV